LKTHAKKCSYQASFQKLLSFFFAFLKMQTFKIWLSFLAYEVYLHHPVFHWQDAGFVKILVLITKSYFMPCYLPTINAVCNVSWRMHDNIIMRKDKKKFCPAARSFWPEAKKKSQKRAERPK